MYGKLFVQMYDGTLATKGPWQALITFQQFIILADKNGAVDMTAEAIARRTTIPLEIIQKGIERLVEPDSESRSPHEEGKRLIPLSETRNWGWKVVNYEHYRKIRSEDERREYHKQYMRKRRSVNSNVNESTPGDQCQPIAVSSKQNAVSNKKQKQQRSIFELPDWIPLAQWNAWIESRTKAKKAPTEWAKSLAVRRLDEFRSQGHHPAQVLAESAFNGWAGLFAPKGKS